MVGNVCVCDVMEEVVEDRAEGAVDCAKSTSQPGPLFLIIVRHVDIGVLHIRNENQVVVHNHVWDEEIAQPSAKAEAVDNPNIKREEEDHAYVTDHNLPEMLLLIEV